MSKLTKNQKAAYAKVEPHKAYKLAEAASLLKEITFTKFDASVDVDVRLGVDPRKANQMVRGVVTLPHGTGKTVRVLVLCTPEKEAEATAAGADYVGLDEYVDKIKSGWTDVDVIICTPNVMGKVGSLGRILGPRGLMPNPKTGTVTMDIAKAVSEVKAGKIDFKVDKYGIIHTSIGKISFTADQIVENAKEVINTIIKLKPSAAKGAYVLSIYLSTTMSPAVINGLTEQLNHYPHFYITDIESLNAEQTASLRRKCFENGIKLVVVKNTLLTKALERAEKAESELVGVLEGSTSVMFTETGKAPAVVIKEFRKSCDKPVLKAAYVEGCVYVGDNQIETLCNIKSREELIGDIISLLQSPAKNVISALQANAGQKIAGLVKALEERNN